MATFNRFSNTFTRDIQREIDRVFMTTILFLAILKDSSLIEARKDCSTKYLSSPSNISINEVLY